MMNTTCYRLVVCEKPSVARSIASVLGAGRREDGFLSGGAGAGDIAAILRDLRLHQYDIQHRYSLLLARMDTIVILYR